MNAVTVSQETQRKDIELEHFKAPYDSSKNGWRFPGGERIGEYKQALRRANQYNEWMVQNV